MGKDTVNPFLHRIRDRTRTWHVKTPFAHAQRQKREGGGGRTFANRDGGVSAIGEEEVTEGAGGAIAERVRLNGARAKEAERGTVHGIAFHIRGVLKGKGAVGREDIRVRGQPNGRADTCGVLGAHARAIHANVRGTVAGIQVVAGIAFGDHARGIAFGAGARGHVQDEEVHGQCTTGFIGHGQGVVARLQTANHGHVGAGDVDHGFIGVIDVRHIEPVVRGNATAGLGIGIVCGRAIRNAARIHNVRGVHRETGRTNRVCNVARGRIARVNGARIGVINGNRRMDASLMEDARVRGAEVPVIAIAFDTQGKGHGRTRAALIVLDVDRVSARGQARLETIRNKGCIRIAWEDPDTDKGTARIIGTVNVDLGRTVRAAIAGLAVRDNGRDSGLRTRRHGHATLNQAHVFLVQGIGFQAREEGTLLKLGGAVIGDRVRVETGFEAANGHRFTTADPNALTVDREIDGQVLTRGQSHLHATRVATRARGFHGHHDDKRRQVHAEATRGTRSSVSGLLCFLGEFLQTHECVFLG